MQMPSFKLVTIFLIQLICVLILLVGLYVSGSITDATVVSNDLGANSNIINHTDLIRTCSTFRDIISEDAAYSCD